MAVLYLLSPAFIALGGLEESNAMNMKSSSIGLAAFLTLALGFLKSRGTLDISWAWVLAPVVIYFVGATFALIKLFIQELSNTSKNKRK